jgi:hypothetical protein
MSLNPNDDIIAKFKRSNQGYLDNLNPEARQAFEELVGLCYPYLPAIAAKAEPFEDDPVALTMMVVQQLIIKSLKEQDSEAENFKDALVQARDAIDHVNNELHRVRKLIHEALSKENRVIPPTSEFQTKLQAE